MKKSLRSKAFRAAMIARKKRSLVTAENVDQTRKRLDKLERYFPVNKNVTIEAVNGKGFQAEWLTSPNSRPDKVILYIHGGGFVFYPKLYRDYISRFGREAQTKVLSLDYSLAPEHPYPTALHEALAAYTWLLSKYSPSSIAVAGDSAGGALVLSLLQQLREEKLPFPACAIALSPASDAMLGSKTIEANKNKDVFIKVESLDYFMDAYFGDHTPRDDPIASPYHGSYKGFPPLMLEVDKDEIMYDDSARVAAKAKKAGVDVTFRVTEGLWHVHHVYARYIPESKESVKNLGQYVRRYLK